MHLPPTVAPISWTVLSVGLGGMTMFCYFTEQYGKFLLGVATLAVSVVVLAKTIDNPDDEE